MDPRAHAPTQQGQPGSLYGFDMRHYVVADSPTHGCAHDAAVRALTHGGIYPIEHAINAIGLRDRAALSVLERHRELQIQPTEASLVLYVNTLGRLHLRPASQERISYEAGDHCEDLGFIDAGAAVLEEIEAAHTLLQQREAEAHGVIRAALEELQRSGEIAHVLDEVIDHVEHVESVCFYLGDRFFALMDRYTNLIDDKRSRGFLSLLREKNFEQWTTEESLAVASLHALFLSGRSVRFEEFNGTLLAAERLLQRLDELAQAYSAAGNEIQVPPDLGLFDRARRIREQTLHAVGKPWLRYRWIYGLNFQKVERILEHSESDEPVDVWWTEFRNDYRLMVGPADAFVPSEHAGMSQLAQAAIARDAAGMRCNCGSVAVTGWVEYLMERIVGSAVVAASADYGMSSSIRDIGRLVTYDDDALIASIHAMTPADFFTCFVSRELVERVGTAEAGVIASSVQKRMQFNRWHFIPGNLDRPLILKSRHWYYPPLIPDIAIHSDMHRAAHNRARVKYSIRSPGPDMSRPSLNIASRYYRGFYDVRVVRMEGDEFEIGDILRVRRRTLWLEALYAALSHYLMSPGAERLVRTGFQAGTYWDIPAPQAVQSGASGGQIRATSPVSDAKTALMAAQA
ncbi:hypothetical protein NU688_32275 [Variovorax sp. ZS18.2.2]|uniref:hypothetical protein n=1 Tax=Variovorax sp. ZS18.2.2 TaxID=2971255 RepID=UPI002150D0CD|nr:hypothetical protein [Variovorax sp. ZS18.2.2]MCR6480872.1 hypothetical protein [Variovorax sp. ZS18.2.2]